MNTGTRLHLVGRGHGRRSSRKRKGYDITPYLFLISGVGSDCVQARTTRSATPAPTGWTATRPRAGDHQRLPGRPDPALQGADAAAAEEWLNSVGIETRAQISYGRPLEISEPGMDVDYPEAENFNQYNQVDIFRLWTGGAKLENKVLSSETGAQIGRYNGTRQMRPAGRLLAYAAGFQRIDLARLGRRLRLRQHRVAGLTTADRLPLSSAPATPASADYDEFNAHLGRVQQLHADRQVPHRRRIHPPELDPGRRVRRRHRQRQRADELAVAHQGVYYRSTELQDNGYTYDYFSPKFLFDDDVHFDEKTKTIEKAGYKAVVLYQDWLDIDGAERHPRLGEEGPEGRHPGGRRLDARRSTTARTPR